MNQGTQFPNLQKSILTLLQIGKYIDHIRVFQLIILSTEIIATR